MYKLRIYKNNGNLSHEEHFKTKKEMDKRYNNLFIYEKYSLNPTAWILKNGNWERILDY